MGYGTVARLFHWITVLLVVTMLGIGLVMVQEIPRGWQDRLFVLHKGLGIVVLLVMLARLGWRVTHQPPPLPASIPAGQARVAEVVHWALYALLIVQAISGYVFVTSGGYPIEVLNALGIPPLLAKREAVAGVAVAVHVAGAYLLMALIVAHVAAAAFHGFVRKDGVVARMWPPVARSR